MKTAYILLFLLAFGPALFAQRAPKKVMGKPTDFSRPVELPEEEFRNRYIKQETKNHLDDVPWIVFSDRDNASTYSEPSEQGQVYRRLPFGDVFYVAEEKGAWIRIGQAKLSGMKVNKDSWQELGWAKKADLLLWTNALQDKLTGIHKKAFLLNKVKDIAEIIKLDRKEIVPLHTSPDGGKTKGDKTIYEFYFILKKENGRYLLAKDAVLTSLTAKESLVGWVRESRVAEWNTRIALEPNFDPEAFAERKTKPNCQVAAYGSDTDARAHATEGNFQKDRAYWNNDPVALPRNQMADSDPRRFRGGVMRFPMLNDNGSYYRTGVIGDITVKTMSEELDKINEVNYSGIMAANENNKRARDNYSVLFVVEGTPAMAAYRQSLLDAVNKIKKDLGGPDGPNLRFGVAVYRDVQEEEHGKLFEMLPLTSSHEKVSDFINNMELAKWADTDPWTAMYYGINQAVLEAGFRKEDTNIMVLLGENGDYRGDRLRRAKYKSHKTYIETSSIVDKLCELDMHLIALQYRNNPAERAVDVFAKQARNFMLENAKCQHDLIRGVPEYMPEITIINPDMPEIGERTDYELKGGTTVAKLLRPKPGSGMAKDDFAQLTAAALNSVHTYTEGFWETMAKIVNDGSSIGEVSSGAFLPIIASKMKAFYEGSSRKQWTHEDVANLSNQRYKLYAEVFVPKHVKGAEHDVFSYVLFMPRVDLEDYLGTLRKLAIARDRSPDEQREQLFNTMIELLKQFTGDESLRNNDPQNTSVEELRRLMQGVAKEGLKLGSDLDDFMIGDFLNKRKMSDEKVQQFVDRILTNTEALSQILKEGKNHEFLYSTGNDSYFWVPIAYTF